MRKVRHRKLGSLIFAAAVLAAAYVFPESTILD